VKKKKQIFVSRDPLWNGSHPGKKRKLKMGCLDATQKILNTSTLNKVVMFMFM